MQIAHCHLTIKLQIFSGNNIVYVNYTVVDIKVNSYDGIEGRA